MILQKRFKKQNSVSIDINFFFFFENGAAIRDLLRWFTDYTCIESTRNHCRQNPLNLSPPAVETRLKVSLFKRNLPVTCSSAIRAAYRISSARVIGFERLRKTFVDQNKNRHEADADMSTE